MIVITPGFEYQIETSDTTTHPTGYQTITFANDDTADLGVINSFQIIDMMLDRYAWLAENSLLGAAECSIAYRLAAKAEAIVRKYVENEETE